MKHFFIALFILSSLSASPTAHSKISPSNTSFVQTVYARFLSRVKDNLHQPVDALATIELLNNTRSPVVTTSTCTGNADVVAGSTNVDNPDEALNVADGLVAELHETGDELVLDLSDLLDAGETY